MKLALPKRTRIILLFLLGIGLPSLLLGYLALRGVQNDKALIKKARLDEHRRMAEQIVGLVDEKIRTVEQAFSDTTNDSQKSPPGELASRLEKLMGEHPLVEQVFHSQDFETIRFPAAKFLYIPDGLRPSIPPHKRPLPAASMIQSAERLEFQQRNYSAALTAYQEALEQAAGDRIRGELLNAVARVQRKSGLFKDAIATYKKIAADFGQVVISNGIPLGLAAGSELSSLLWETGDDSASLGTLLSLYEALLKRRWVLEKAQFEFFLRRVKDSTSEIFLKPPAGLQVEQPKSAFQNLEIEEERRRDHTERALAFQANADSDLAAKLSARAFEPGRAALRLTMDIGKHAYKDSPD